MERIGKVLEDRGEQALVLLKRHMACEGCGRCGGILGGSDIKDEEVEVANPIGAIEGEMVQVEIDDQKVLLLSFVIYFVPVLALLIGLIFGQWVVINFGWTIEQNLASVIFGFFLMFITFLFIRRWDQFIKKTNKYKPVITSLVDHTSVDKTSFEQEQENDQEQENY